jgi:hypothetical protein
LVNASGVAARLGDRSPACRSRNESSTM